MRQEQLVVLVAVLVTASVCAIVTAPLLRWLPEPAEPDGKLPYAALATPHVVLACILSSAVAAAVAWTTLPAVVQPLWAVLAVGGVVLAVIDTVTTWLPLQLTHITWAAMAFATMAAASLAGEWSLLLRAAAGAAVAGGLYLLVWLGSRGGFGFGDVRFAPLLGAATAADSWQLLVWALVAGSVLGAAVGVVRLATRRHGAFPYAPAMLGGAFVAALAQALFT